MVQILTAKRKSLEYGVLSGPIAVELDLVGVSDLAHVRSLDGELSAAHE